jgi:hypothetical protein
MRRIWWLLAYRTDPHGSRIRQIAKNLGLILSRWGIGAGTHWISRAWYPAWIAAGQDTAHIQQPHGRVMEGTGGCRRPQGRLQSRPQTPQHADSLQAFPLILPHVWPLEPSDPLVIHSASPFLV